MFKKFLILTIILFAPINSFATTLGSSLGINVGLSKLRTREKNILQHSEKDLNANFGFFYKYNWNVDKFIIGVGVFYDYLNLKASYKISSIHLRYRHGIDFNLGYNITENSSIYGIFGYGLMKYNSHSYDNNGFKINETKSRPIYGFGIDYSFSVSWKIGLEYNIQKINVGLDNCYTLKNKIESLNLLLVYKF